MHGGVAVQRFLKDSVHQLFLHFLSHRFIGFVGIYDNIGIGDRFHNIILDAAQALTAPNLAHRLPPFL